jgi:hypothetical protein
MSVMAFDPGKRLVGWATADERGLVRCGLVHDETQTGLLKKLRGMCLETATRGIRVVIEVPQVYRERHWRGDPNDLIDETITVGALVAFTLDADQRLVRPHAWKGGVPKDVHNRRILMAMTPDETEVLEHCGVCSRLRHNVIDAIGLAKYGAVDR